MEYRNRTRKLQKKFFVTAEENEFLNQKMRAAGMKNFSAFARYMLIMGEVKVMNFEELGELRHAINKIGVNVNQIAKKVNEEDEASLEELVLVLELQKEIRKMVNDFLSYYEKKRTRKK